MTDCHHFSQNSLFTVRLRDRILTLHSFGTLAAIVIFSQFFEKRLSLSHLRLFTLASCDCHGNLLQRSSQSPTRIKNVLCSLLFHFSFLTHRILLRFIFSVVPKTSYKAIVLSRSVGYRLRPSGMGCKVLKREISSTGFCFLAYSSRVLALKLAQNDRV